MKKIIILTLITINCNSFAQLLPSDSAKMQWFYTAKLGIFMHWGIYAVDGTAESWAFFRNEVPYNQYMAQKNGFTASKYDPESWAALFVEAGARYAVLTSKHHDGVALWDTKYSDLNVVKATPAGRDLIDPYCKAMQKANLKVGIYFSHLDWSHPDYASVASHAVLFDEKRNPFSYPPKGKEDIFRWEKFLLFHRGQIKELCTLYKPDLLWFDGTWERDDEHWRMKELRDSILVWKPGVILNSRMRGYGDYETPEQAIPVTRPDKKWELCMTMNNSWGYRQSDTNYKTPLEIIRTFVECIGNGGNLLLDIGPMEDGTIPKPQIERLKILGQWIRRNEPAIYSTSAGLPLGHFYGQSTLSADKKTIYLFVSDQPHEYIPLKGIRNKIKSINVLATGEQLTYKISGGAPWVNIPGDIHISLPKKYDDYITVIAIELDGTINLYHDKGY